VNPPGFAFSQTDRFDPPVNQGNPPEYHVEKPNHWHFTAATKQPAARTTVVAAMLVKDGSEQLEVAWKPNGIEIETPSGAGALSATLEPALRLSAKWHPTSGPAETLEI